MTPFEQALVDRTEARERVRFDSDGGWPRIYEVRQRSDDAWLGRVRYRPRFNRWYFSRPGHGNADPECPVLGYGTRLAAAAGLLEAREMQ